MPRPIRHRPAPSPLSPPGRTERTPTAAPVDAAPRSRPAAPADRLDGVSASRTADLRPVATRRGTSIAALRTAIFLPGQVRLSERGFTVDGQNSKTTARVTNGSIKTLFTAAERLCACDDNPFRGRGLNAAVRTELAVHLERFVLEGQQSGCRPSRHQLMARSAGFALLVRLCQAMTRSEQASLRDTVDVLLGAARREPDHDLQRQMLLGLQSLTPRSLCAEQVSARKELVDRLLPSSPPYDRWFGNNDQPKLRVRQYVMDEFWRQEISAYRQAGFRMDNASASEVVATKMLEDPEGRHPPVRAEVVLVKAETNVLRDMDDPNVDVVFYSGHAQLGGVAKTSLASAPRRAHGDKLVGFFACRGKQWLGSVRRRFPDSQVMVSRNGTYGHDDRIVIQQFFAGVARRSSYAQMGKAVEAQGLWEKDNYLFPDDPRGLAHVDLDRDGKSADSGGRPDLLCSPPLARGGGNSVSFRPKKGAIDSSRLDGSKISDAVSWLNTEFFYWAETFGSKHELALADRIRPDGWFTSADPSELVRLNEVEGADGKPLLRLQVNAAYGHLSADALGMLTTFGAVMQLLERSRPEQPLSERRMQALAMTSAYAYYLVEYSDVADLLLHNFAKQFGFPPTLSWPVVEKAVGADHHDEASPKVIDLLEKGMRYPFLEVNPRRIDLAFRGEVAKALDLLRHSDTRIGRETYEAIVTGRVQIDTLSDLSRKDFNSLRKELRSDGVELEAADYERLEDKAVMRAITSTINGYMWDDRIYAARRMPSKVLASTLVHEVNHVINRSEESYRSARGIFVEEYRAFYSEALFRGEDMSPTACKKLKDEVIETYNLYGVTADDVPDVPPGLLFPGEEHGG